MAMGRPLDGLEASRTRIEREGCCRNLCVEYGGRGWELVHVLDGSATGDRTNRLIFKSEKPLVGLEDT
jgi:hypothetical protein